ncbi:hypothetical protein Ahy_B09g098836 isoform A [Arachis hypogaea]|uniref:Uncharacterized protein n=1 Tax=Arachis hypogaea TaxID=3818 RepID=A0A444XT14_ARAHY|nr:hypothetical protein Ahy_B09g098836 isoform A [Arachis hypogaea]
MPASRHHGKGFACNFQAPHSAFLSAKGQDVRKILKRKDSDTGEKAASSLSASASSDPSSGEALCRCVTTDPPSIFLFSSSTQMHREGKEPASSKAPVPFSHKQKNYHAFIYIFL